MLRLEEELKVLIVEDNPDDFYLIEHKLKKEVTNPVIYQAETFAEAEQYIRSERTLHCILLDLSLPDASGEQLVRQIMQMCEPTPIIVITGQAEKEFGMKILEMGVSDYLFKNGLSSEQLFKSIIYSVEQMRISRKLKDSEEKYRTLFSLSPIPMWVFDVDTLQFLNVNEAAVIHYGYSREEFIQMTILDIRPGEDADMVQEIVDKGKKSGAFSWGEFRHLKKNGEMIYVDIQSNLMEFEDRKARLVLATDITDRVSYMQAIEYQNQRLREIAWTQSHVVRAPLARMMGLINMLERKDTFKGNPDQLLPYLMGSAKELDNIIRDIIKKTEDVEIQ